MENTYLGSLLHLADPTLPIGGYTHSNGLETYVQDEAVNSVASAKEFVTNMLMYNIKYNDASFLKLAYVAAENNDLETIIKLDQECSALKSPREIREASQKLGIRLIKIFRRQKAFDLVNNYERAITDKKASAHYCIAFGIYAQLLEIPLDEALFAFYYNAAIGMITNSVKLVPLGQLDGQDVLFELQPLLKKLAKETLTIDRELVGLCSVAFDIRCMQHERLYSRLYMS
ncbi:urease accessory protein UreF [Flavobacterium sharifuzzamanii]|uniref:urease accessory protein UreF n=1 Tax=Flavobacterium sharifuzzamanii TaxID=2211133 RepID=UPI000DAC5168|nr:urease accessory protein UreF [Flavobacterium sharifuzzamanii]KAF2081026.1 urease accessory protein UreF [Flavobacterium sharifuzzamanii]